MKEENNTPSIAQIHAEREKELEASMANLLDELRKSAGDKAETLDSLLHERGKGLRLYRLRDCAVLDGDRPVKIPASQFGMRKGRYSYYYDGFKTIPLDDFNIEGQRLLILGKGAVSTHTGKLVVVKAQGRFSVSPSFHTVRTAEEDFIYLSIVLGGVDATRLIKGTRLAHTIEAIDLQMALIPWPDLRIRQAFSEVWSFVQFIHEGAFAQDLLDYWMLSVKNRDMLVKDPVDKPNVDVTTLVDLGDHEDHSDGVLALAEGFISVLEHENDTLLDVVAATSDLAKPIERQTADLCICFPPPNQEIWIDGRVDEQDLRWIFGPPPRNKANYAWIQQTIACMTQNGSAVMMLCNAPLHSEIGREKDLRESFAQSNLIDAVISLPGGLFLDGRPPVSLVILQKGREKNAPVLFVDIQDDGIDQGFDDRGFVVRSLSHETIERVVSTYSQWKKNEDYSNRPGFCQQVLPGDIRDIHYELMSYCYLE